jgi:hypothetical protein
VVQQIIEIMTKENYNYIMTYLDKRIKALEGGDELKSINESIGDERIAQELRKIRKIIEAKVNSDFKQCVAVVCNNLATFRKWKNCFAETKNIDTKKFIAHETLYLAVIKPEDVCGYTFDDVTCLFPEEINSETLSAIYLAIKPVLKSK